MLSKEINIPKFKLSHLLIVISILILIGINLFQWYLNRDNHIFRNEFKVKEKRINFKLDSIKKINFIYKDSIKFSNALILQYKEEISKQKTIRKNNKNESNKRKKDFNSLNDNDRFSAVKKLLAERIKQRRNK